MSTRIAIVLAFALAVPALAQTAKPKKPAAPASKLAPAAEPAKPVEPAPETPAAVPAAGAPALDSEKAKVSYVIGTRIGSNIKRDQLELDLDALVAGLRDAVAGQESRVSAADGEAAMAAFQQKLGQKQEKASSEMAERNAKAGAEFLETNGKRSGVTTTASGLQYEILKKGDGPMPKRDDRVKVHYHGTLIDGTVFDSSVQRNEPATFGVTQVIPGWIEALQLMPAGSKWKLFIPSELAYKERGTPDGTIGPNAALIFEVELLGIE
jgi:FKBP-type peptidyl-prolyl cis-trans isomerase FklB